jgi:hypothetical protein
VGGAWVQSRERRKITEDVAEGVANLQYDRKVKPSSQKQIFLFFDILGSSPKIMRSGRLPNRPVSMS